jgi:hypothetical protein
MGLLAASAMQQGLLRLKRNMVPKGDPAVAEAILQAVFEASQDVMDQLGHASAIQHYSRHLQAIKGVNLSSTELQSPLLRLHE